MLAIQQNEGNGAGQLPEALTTQARAFILEIETLLARVSVRIDPPTARLAVDGRPLQRAGGGNDSALVAGLRNPGAGEPAPGRSFDVLVDPGAHVFAVSAQGFTEVVVNRSFAPGSSQQLDLRLSRLPAALHIEADREGAVVAVDGMDVGVAPVDIARPGGKHRVVLRQRGFVTYDTSVAVRPGEEVTIRGRLPPLEKTLTERWWFWTIAGAVVAGAAATTYALTRPDPQRPPPDGGSLGWVITAK
jgi:hypothetical protein